jgi:hypothetical protein
MVYHQEESAAFEQSCSALAFDRGVVGNQDSAGLESAPGLTGSEALSHEWVPLVT